MWTFDETPPRIDFDKTTPWIEVGHPWETLLSLLRFIVSLRGLAPLPGLL
ncbi:MAG TPA: hypothetical protein VFB08_07815 [Burkholderiales bacterium]|nr:hypothetical protein [Burkholderiales bacterium]